MISPTQDIYGTRAMLARLLDLPAEKIQVRYQEGASNYGHGCQDDATQAAALGATANGDAGRDRMPDSDRSVRPMDQQHHPDDK